MYDRFVKLCAIKGVTISQACKEIGISPGAVTNWKTRNNHPKGDTCTKIANYFGVTIDYLFTGEDRPQEAQDIINHVGRTIEALRPMHDTFIEEFQNDTVFMENIRLLWSLSPELKDEVYKCIQFQYYKLNAAAEEKKKAIPGY